jgi:hypothetical protein
MGMIMSNIIDYSELFQFFPGGHHRREHTFQPQEIGAN